MRAEQLLNRVEQRIKSFFVHDSLHLQHEATSVQEESSQAVQSPAASDERLASSSKPQNEPIRSATEEIVAGEISKSESIPQASSEEQHISSTKPQNEPVEAISEEIAPQKISEYEPTSQEAYMQQEQLSPSSKSPDEAIGPGFEETTSGEISEHEAVSQATLQEQATSSSKPLDEAIGPISKETASKGISEHEAVSQATLQEQATSSSKSQNKQVGPVSKETAPKEISEYRPASQAVYGLPERPIAFQTSPLRPTLMTSWMPQERSLVEGLAILLLASQPIKVQQQILVETLSNLLSTLTQQKIAQQRELLLAEVLSILLIASQQ
jgi:hypothetical protein